MSDGYVVLVPQITAVAITPNPAVINNPITITITATETQITLYPEPRYSGEFYAGEV